MDYKQYWEPLQKKLKKNASDQDAITMAKYMRNKFPFLGIKKTEADAITKDFLQKNPIELQYLEGFVMFLWEKQKREYHYVALRFLEMNFKKLPETYITIFEKLIQEKSWWDTVDVLATRLVGRLLKKYPDLKETYPQKWIASENIWLQRTALLYQLKYKKETNFEELFDFILQKANAKEFFIQKAIGWALREYSKTDSEVVVQFVQQHKLSTLSRREALKWLKKHKH